MAAFSWNSTVQEEIKRIANDKERRWVRWAWPVLISVVALFVIASINYYHDKCTDDDRNPHRESNT